MKNNNNGIPKTENHHFSRIRNNVNTKKNENNNSRDHENSSNHKRVNNEKKNALTQETLFSVHLVRYVQLRSYPILAKVTFQRPRSDLVSLLEETEKNQQNIPARLRTYLKNEQLLDEERCELTERGKAVLSSGHFETNERGLYRIWYTDKDAIFQTRPILIQRDSALFEPEKTKTWKKGTDASLSSFRIDSVLNVQVQENTYNKNEPTSLLMSKLIPEVICSSFNSGKLELNWNIELNRDAAILNSNTRLQGELDRFSFDKNKETKHPQNINILSPRPHPEEDLYDLMTFIQGEFEGVWDKEAQRLAAPLERIPKESNAVKHFKIISYPHIALRTEFGDFERVTLKNIPIKPMNQNDAACWQQRWLEDYYSHQYRSSTEAREQQARWLDHCALSDFTLPLKEGANLLESITHKKNTALYWHVAAMTDLTPAKNKKSKHPISLMNKEGLILHNLIQTLTERVSIQHMIYADRYVHTPKQIRNLNTLSLCLNDAKGTLFTLDTPKGNEATLPARWTREIQQKHPDNHGRYWIFISHSEIHAWECTCGLDFIQGNSVEGFPTFTPKEVHELPEFLQDAIKKIKSGQVS